MKIATEKHNASGLLYLIALANTTTCDREAGFTMYSQILMKSLQIVNLIPKGIHSALDNNRHVMFYCVFRGLSSGLENLMDGHPKKKVAVQVRFVTESIFLFLDIAERSKERLR